MFNLAKIWDSKVRTTEMLRVSDCIHHTDWKYNHIRPEDRVLAMYNNLILKDPPATWDREAESVA